MKDELSKSDRECWMRAVRENPEAAVEKRLQDERMRELVLLDLQANGWLLSPEQIEHTKRFLRWLDDALSLPLPH